MTEKRYCILCGGEFQSDDPDVVFCLRHGKPAPPPQEQQAAQPKPQNRSQFTDTTAWKPGDIILDTYEVKGMLGKGGFGQVYRVHHRGWDLDLAVKRALNLDESNKQTFIDEAEKWIDLGLHPHVISCYYVRSINNFPHTFAELAEGKSLHDWIIGNGFNLYDGDSHQVLQNILDIAIQFAWGLAYAHEQGLVHQDVKPQNALMTLDGILKVTDFGLAKAGKKSATGSAQVTMGGYTPAYCSPEQANRQKLSQKTDIWSWAVSVLEMFNGRITWAGGQIADSALESYLRQSGDSHIPRMPNDLIHLLRECFHREPGRRPADMLIIAKRLIQLFQRVADRTYSRKLPKQTEMRSDTLNNKAVSMLDLGRDRDAAANWESSIKNDPHHLETVFNYGYWLWQDGKQTDQTYLEQINKVRALHPEHENIDWLSGLVHAEIGHLEKAIPYFKKDGKKNNWQVEMLLAACHELMGNQNDTRKVLMELQADHQSSISHRFGLENLNAVRSYFTEHPLPWRRCDLTLGGKAYRNEYGLFSITPDGRFALVGAASAPILFDMVEKRQITILKKRYSLMTSIVGLGLSWDGSRAATLVNDKTILLWDAFEGKVVKRIKGLPEYPGQNAFSKDLKYLVYLDALHQLCLWDIEKEDCIMKLQIPVALPERGYMMTRLLAMDAEARFCLLIMRDEMFGIELPQGHLLFRQKLPKNFVRHVVLTPDGSHAMLGGDKGEIWLWDVQKMSHQVLEGIEHHISCLAITPDAHYGVSCSRGEYLTKDNTLRLWDLRKNRCIWTSPQQNEDIYAIAISGDAKYVYSYSDYGPLRRYIVDAGLERNARAYSPLPHVFAIPLSGTQAVEILEQSRTLKKKVEEFEMRGRWHEAYQLLRQIQQDSLNPWDETTLEGLHRVGKHGKRSGLHAAALNQQLKGHTGRVFCLANRTGNQEVLSGGDDYQLRRWDLGSGECISVIDCNKTSIKSIAIDPMGRYALFGGGGMNIYGDFLIRVLDLERNRIISKVNLTQRMTHDLAFGLDARIAAVVSDRFLFVFQPLEGSVYHRLKGHVIRIGGKRDSAGTPICTAFFPDGRHVLSGGDDQTICMWDLKSGKRIRRFQAPRGHVDKVMVMPGGEKILSAHSDHFLRVWHIDEEKPILEVDTGGRVEGFTLTKDGRFVFSCGEDNSIKLWDLKTKESCLTLEGHSNLVSDLALVMDECCLISGSWDGTLGVWFLDWEFEF